MKQNLCYFDSEVFQVYDVAVFFVNLRVDLIMLKMKYI